MSPLFSVCFLIFFALLLILVYSYIYILFWIFFCNYELVHSSGEGEQLSSRSLISEKRKVILAVGGWGCYRRGEGRWSQSDDVACIVSLQANLMEAGRRVGGFSSLAFSYLSLGCVSRIGAEPFLCDILRRVSHFPIRLICMEGKSLENPSRIRAKRSSSIE